jgi:Tfp pilus assembly protein PilP
MGVFFILIHFSAAWAQGGAQGSSLTPAEMSQFRDSLAEMEAKKNSNPPPAQPPTPVAAPPVQPPPTEVTNVIQPFVPAELPEDKRPQEAVINNSQRVKSPFMIPNELFIKLKKRAGEKTTTVDIDDTVEVRLRWPLKDYRLVGVIYDTKTPKAMIADRQGKVDVYRVKDLIANAGGYIAEITNGEVIVVEKGAEVKLQLTEK